MQQRKRKAVPALAVTEIKLATASKATNGEETIKGLFSLDKKLTSKTPLANPDVQRRKRRDVPARPGPSTNAGAETKKTSTPASRGLFTVGKKRDAKVSFAVPSSKTRPQKAAPSGKGTGLTAAAPEKIPRKSNKQLLSLDKEYTARLRSCFPGISKTNTVSGSPFLAAKYGYKKKRNGKDHIDVVPPKDFLAREPRPTLPPHPCFRRAAWSEAIDRLAVRTNQELIEHIILLPPSEQSNYFHLFDGVFYAESYPHADASSPIKAFLTEGIFQGQRANPFLVDSGFWLRLTHEVCGATLVEGYSSEAYINKAAENFETSGFSADLERRFDVQSLADWECLDRYLQSARYIKWRTLFGKFGGLDHEVYRDLNSDLRSLSDSELVSHYEEFGKREGRIHNFFDILMEKHTAFNALNERFDWCVYKENNMDLHSSLTNATEFIAHYIRSGFRENRPVSRPPLYFKADAVANYLPFRRSEATSLPTSSHGDVKVMFHVFNQEEVGTYLDLIEMLRQCGAQVYVNVAEQCLSAERLAALVAVDAKIFISKNAGRDFGGFFHILDNVEIDDDDIAVLLHTKRSVHVTPEYAKRWVSDLKYAIGNNIDQLRQNFELMRTDKTVMAIGPLARYALDAGGKNNRTTLSQLLTKLNINQDLIAAPFITGTMGFYRGAVLNVLKTVVKSSDFEAGQPDNLAFNIDGQIAHSLERLLTIVAFARGRVVWR